MRSMELIPTAQASSGVQQLTNGLTATLGHDGALPLPPARRRSPTVMAASRAGLPQPWGEMPLTSWPSEAPLELWGLVSVGPLCPFSGARWNLLFVGLKWGSVIHIPQLR